MSKELNSWLLAGGLALFILWCFKVLKYTLFALVFIISFGYFKFTEKRKYKKEYYRNYYKGSN